MKGSLEIMQEDILLMKNLLEILVKKSPEMSSERNIVEKEKMNQAICTDNSVQTEYEVKRRRRDAHTKVTTVSFSSILQALRF